MNRLQGNAKVCPHKRGNAAADDMLQLAVRWVLVWGCDHEGRSFTRHSVKLHLVPYSPLPVGADEEEKQTVGGEASFHTQAARTLRCWINQR